MNLAHFFRKRYRSGAAYGSGPAAIVLALVAQGSSPAPAAPADPVDPVALVRTYLAGDSAEARAAAVARLAAHPGYKAERLSDWLHQAASHPDRAPGEHTMSVAIGDGDVREVTLIVPEGYRPDRPWPLIYALHPSGEPGAKWAAMVRSMLGSRANEFVIASPHNYRQNYIAANPPFTAEHPTILDAMMREIHVQAGRVYVFGYSKGAFGAWFNALYYSDRFAGAVAFAGGFDVAIDAAGLWKALVMNVANVPVYNAWGERDTLIARGIDGKPDGTFVEQNRRFVKAIEGLGLPVINIEVPGGVHNALSPPGRPMGELLRMRRVSEPRRITHTFRHLHQASCSWLEGTTWVGDRWGAEDPPLLPAHPGEPERDRLARTLEPLLARLTGEIDGQHLRVTRRHIGDLLVWFGDKMIDWERPIRLEVDGKVVFEGRVERQPGVALARAAMTRDFDRLKWAGLRVDASGATRPVTAADVPEPVWRRR